MEKYFEIEGINCVDTSEAIFGDFVVLGNKLLIPYFNVKIVCKNNINLESYFGNYIRFCVLSFEEINGILWEYQERILLSGKIIECYGGEYYLDKNYREFWISYGLGKIILKKGLEYNNDPWDYNYFSNDFGGILKDLH
jgi:hypothetical protein